MECITIIDYNYYSGRGRGMADGANKAQMILIYRTQHCQMVQEG